MKMRERESYFLNVLKLLYRERGVEERVVKQKVQEEFDLSRGSVKVLLLLLILSRVKSH